MFTKQEITLMRKIGLELDLEHPEKLTDDEWVHISDVIEDRYMTHELYEKDGDYCTTPDGKICEDILEKLARMD